MPPKKGKKIKTKTTLDLSSLTNLVTNIKDAIETLNLYTASFDTKSTKKVILARINTWCKYFYYILDHYEFVKLGRVMRDHFRILGNNQLVDMEATTDYFWSYKNYLNSGINSDKCLFWKGSLEYLNYSIQKLKVSYDDSTQARIDGIEADIIEFHDKLIYCCTCLSERIQNLYKGFTISYSDIQTSGIWLQISLKTPDNVDDTVYGIDQLRRGDNLSLSEFTLNFREKFLKLNSNNNNNNSTASSSNSIIDASTNNHTTEKVVSKKVTETMIHHISPIINSQKDDIQSMMSQKSSEFEAQRINTTEKSSTTYSKEDEQQPHDTSLSNIEKSIKNDDNDIEDDELDDLFKSNLSDFSDQEPEIVYKNTSDGNIIDDDLQDSDDEENNNSNDDRMDVVVKKETLIGQLSKTPVQIYNMYNDAQSSKTIPAWTNAPLKYFDENQSYDAINKSFVKQMYDDMVDEYIQSAIRFAKRKDLINEFVKLNMLRFPQPKLVSFVKSTFKNMEEKVKGLIGNAVKNDLIKYIYLTFIKRHINDYSKDREDSEDLQSLYLLYHGDIYDTNTAHWFEKGEEYKDIKAFMDQFRPFYKAVDKLSQYEEMIKLCRKKYDNQLNITNIKSEVKLILNELATQMKVEVDPAYVMNETINDDKKNNNTSNNNNKRKRMSFDSRMSLLMPNNDQDKIFYDNSYVDNLNENKLSILNEVQHEMESYQLIEDESYFVYDIVNPNGKRLKDKASSLVQQKNTNNNITNNSNSSTSHGSNNIINKDIANDISFRSSDRVSVPTSFFMDDLNLCSLPETKSTSYKKKKTKVDDDDNDEQLNYIQDLCDIYNKHILDHLATLNENAKDNVCVKESTYLGRSQNGETGYVPIGKGLFCKRAGNEKTAPVVYYTGFYYPKKEYDKFIKENPDRVNYALSVNEDIVYDCYDQAKPFFNTEEPSCLASMANCFEDLVKRRNKSIKYVKEKTGTNCVLGNAKIIYKYINLRVGKLPHRVMKIFGIKYIKDVKIGDEIVVNYSRYDDEIFFNDSMEDETNKTNDNNNNKMIIKDVDNNNDDEIDDKKTINNNNDDEIDDKKTNNNNNNNNNVIDDKKTRIGETTIIEKTQTNECQYIIYPAGILPFSKSVEKLIYEHNENAINMNRKKNKNNNFVKHFTFMNFLDVQNSNIPYLQYAAMFDNLSLVKENEHLIIFNILKAILMNIGPTEFLMQNKMFQQYHKYLWFYDAFNYNIFGISPVELLLQLGSAIQHHLKNLYDVSNCIDYFYDLKCRQYAEHDDSIISGMKDEICSHILLFIKNESEFTNNCIVLNNSVIDENSKKNVCDFTLNQLRNFKIQLTEDFEIRKELLSQLWPLRVHDKEESFLELLYFIGLDVEQAYCNNNANAPSATTTNKFLATTIIESSSAHHSIINDNNEDDGYIGNNYNDNNNNSSNKNIFNPNVMTTTCIIVTLNKDSTIHRHDSASILTLLALYNNDAGDTAEQSADKIIKRKIGMRFNKLSQEIISDIAAQSKIIEVAMDLDEKQRTCFISTDDIYKNNFKVDDLILIYVRKLKADNNQDKYFIHNIEEFYQNKWKLNSKAFYGLINPTEWIMDRVIERYIFYQNMYILRWNYLCQQPEHKINVLIFSTLVMHSICGSFDTREKYVYKKILTEGLNYVNGNGIFDYESLLLVANDRNSHWYMYEIKPQSNAIIIYDPALNTYKSRYSNQTDRLIRFLCDEAKNKIKSEEMIQKYTQTWNVSVRSDMPKQENGHDCGMFVMMVMDRLIHKIPLDTVRQEDMEHNRYCIAKMFYNNSLFVEDDML